MSVVNDKEMVALTLPGILTAFSLSTRFYNLSIPAYVCWDETHFGKFAGHYINRTYFVDVHPPLGKMLIAMIGLLTGYDGQFAFATPGDEYITNSTTTAYYGMRAFSAFLGSMVIPLMFYSVKNLTSSSGAAFLASAFLIFDCGLITLSQYILLDPILLFFTSATVFCTSKCSTLASRGRNFGRGNCITPFMQQWWMYLALSGLFLGCTVSVKWTGMFTFILVAYWSGLSLCNVLDCDKRMKKGKPKRFFLHVLARITCLIFIPSCVYISFFALHFQVLNISGKADNFHSSRFQSCLKGNPLHGASMPLHPAYGSVVSLKYFDLSTTGLIHSTNELYPTNVMMSPNQQVSLYYHRDVDNFWEILKPSQGVAFAKNSNFGDGDKLELLRDGSLLQLRHFQTKRLLSIRPLPAPLSPQEYIVFAQYDKSTEQAEAAEVWELKIAEKPGIDGEVEVLSTLFWMIHLKTGCYLRSSGKVLPDWGEGRSEITCSPHSYHQKYSLWNIEQHTHRDMDDREISHCEMSFWDKFLESHYSMLAFHSNFEPLQNGSRVWHWPLDFKGQAFTRMGEDDTRVYLLGNPLIFWLNLFVLLLYPGILVHLTLQSRGEKCPDVVPGDTTTRRIDADEFMQKVHVKNILLSPHFCACKLFLFGWAVHYFPFFFLSRVVYFHHYYPAFLFSCCLSGCFLDFLFTAFSLFFSRVFPRFVAPHVVKISLLSGFVVCLVESFSLYLPLCYGVTGPFSNHNESVMRGLKFLSGWDI